MTTVGTDHPPIFWSVVNNLTAHATGIAGHAIIMTSLGQQNESTRARFLVNMPVWLTISLPTGLVEKADLKALRLQRRASTSGRRRADTSPPPQANRPAWEAESTTAI